jgi:Ca2+-binding EF-hand superfamily protein
MSRKRFADIYKRFYPESKSSKFCDHSFKIFDEDNDGQLSFEEFLTAISIISDSDPQRKLAFTFKLYDLNKNGVVCLKEIQNMIEAVYIKQFHFI